MCLPVNRIFVCCFYFIFFSKIWRRKKSIAEGNMIVFPKPKKNVLLVLWGSETGKTSALIFLPVLLENCNCILCCKGGCRKLYLHNFLPFSLADIYIGGESCSGASNNWLSSLPSLHQHCCTLSSRQPNLHFRKWDMGWMLIVSWHCWFCYGYMCVAVEVWWWRCTMSNTTDHKDATSQGSVCMLLLLM